VTLYALVAADSPFAVDVFVNRELADQALRDVLFDEPAFSSLLSIEPIPPPWAHEHDQRSYLVAMTKSTRRGGGLPLRPTIRRPLPRPGEERRRQSTR
jgi:hypothetical protein